MTRLNNSVTAFDQRDATFPGQVDQADFDVILESRPGWRAVDFEELYSHRDLLAYWTWRNIKGRHAQSALGLGWAIIQPVVNTVIFTVVFGTLVGVKSDGVPYPLFALCGMMMWTYFSSALREAVESLTQLSRPCSPRSTFPG